MAAARPAAATKPTRSVKERKKALAQFRQLLLAQGKLFEAGKILRAQGLPHGAAHLELVELLIVKKIDEIQDAAYEALEFGVGDGEENPAAENDNA